ncbi:hypothetical protein DFH11DRAFT_1863736 [Phellopilus nigrolimitatus]|nr:hypothetical protein DFH11DRAFT_1863736 [Phellopilus nigrolimitatus]
MPAIAWFHRALTLAVVLHDMGLHSEALQLDMLNTQVIQKLAEGHGDLYDPDHAVALHNLSFDLSKLDRHKEALEASQKEVTIRQALSENNPDRFNPGLADSLHSLSFILSKLDRHKEALETIQKAVAIRHALSEKDPDKFNPGLASSLNNLSYKFLRLGRHAEATVHIEESIALFESLPKEKQFQQYDVDFGMALETYSDVLEVTGQHRKALEIAREAVIIFQKYSGMLSQVEKGGLKLSQKRITRLEFT